MIAEKILALRNARGWVQKDLAQKAGLSRIVISRYENGTIPSQRNLFKILKAFNLPKDYFLKLESENSPVIHKDYLKDAELVNAINGLIQLKKQNQQIVFDLIKALHR